MSKKAPKRLAPPGVPLPEILSSIVPDLPLYELPGTKIAISEANMRWRWLGFQHQPHVWLKGPPDEWLATVRSLADKAAADDDALFELLRLDPRYLGAPLVQAKVLQWKLDILIGQLHLPASDEDFDESDATERANQARSKLTALGNTIGFVTGRGHQRKWSHSAVRREYRAVLQAVDEAKLLLGRLKMARDEDFQEIADQTKLPERFVRELSANPRRREGVARAVIAPRYNNIGEETLRKVLRKAAASDDDELYE